MLGRPLVLAGAVLGVCYLAEVPVVDWLLSLVQLLCYIVTSLLWAFWQLLQPSQDKCHSSLPELHQAVLNVTNDASRVADLLDEFMGQYSSDPQLKAKFLTFMADQADTKYSVVDNQLNWVLWLYSLIWMPLLVLMCLTRMGKGSGSHERQTVPTGQPVQQQQAAGGAYSTDQLAKLRVSSSSHMSGDAAGMYSSSGTAGGTGPDLMPRRRMQTASGSLDLPPRYSVPGSFGRPYGDNDIDGSTRSAAATGRSLRSAINSGSIGRQRASSDWMHMSRPSKMQQGTGGSALPPHLGYNNSSSSYGPSAGSLEGQKLAGYGLNARLSAGFDRQGSNVSGAGADTRGAGADQRGMGRSSSQHWVQQGTVFLDSDAAAAADGLTVR